MVFALHRASEHQLEHKINDLRHRRTTGLSTRSTPPPESKALKATAKSHHAQLLSMPALIPDILDNCMIVSLRDLRRLSTLAPIFLRMFATCALVVGWASAGRDAFRCMLRLSKYRPTFFCAPICCVMWLPHFSAYNRRINVPVVRGRYK